MTSVPQPSQRSSAVPWFVGSGLCVPLAVVALVVGLEVGSLALVYLSIASSLAWLPLLVVGIVKVARKD